MYYALAAIAGLTFIAAVRVFFWYKGKLYAEQEAELDAANNLISEIDKKKKRDNIIDINDSVRDRLHALYGRKSED